MKRILLSMLLVAATVLSASAQEPLKLPALSPTAKMTQEFSTSNIELTYSRPSMRGRRIFGDVVPYDKVWRTGANSATKIKFGEEVTIGGIDIKPGEYALYTIPGKTEWEVILNKGTGNWGTAGYATDMDVARFKVKPVMVDKNYQTFTMEFASITLNSCKLEMMWERTKVEIPIVSQNEQRLDAAIDKAISNPQIPYFQAASYYYETNQSLDKANMYVDKALEQNPNGYFIWFLKAKIEKKLGHKKEAVAAAKKSMELAKGSAFEYDYSHGNQKILDELK